MHVPVRPALRLAVLGAMGATLLAAQLAGGPGTTGTGDPVARVASSNQVATTSADAVRRAYAARWAPALGTRVTGGGSAGSCAAATTSAAQQTATRDAINFARGLVGANAVSFTAAYDAAAARAAVIMAANGKLSHDPPSSWSCWSQAGHDAAARSNILLDGSAPSAARIASLYLDDGGTSNTAAGHRRWLLRPEATTMGSGNAQGDGWFGNAIYVLTQKDDDAKAAAKAYYAWPAAGYFPTQLEPGGRWSLSSSSGASFADAKVAVTGPDGSAVRVTQRAVTKGYADNTLVWDLADPPAAVASAVPRTYTVTVSGISGGPTPSYTYYVRLFDPTRAAPADEPATLPADVSALATATTGSAPASATHGKRTSLTLSSISSKKTPVTGTVALYVDGKLRGHYAYTAANRSRVVVAVTFSAKGRHTVQAVYLGSTEFKRSTSAARTVTVR